MERSVQTFLELALEVSVIWLSSWKESQRTADCLAGTAACDIAITVSLVIMLTNRKMTVFEEMMSLINQYVRLNIETGSHKHHHFGRACCFPGGTEVDVAHGYPRARLLTKTGIVIHIR
ncbi:hypothetical protein BDZ89DRAFT_1076906 [Hymenopellis radicata]|nr:hypothetical protein BDZ89DRAFT_1076906 [Hymenopellis radicata]